jgi:hypothetical protein
MWEVPKVFFQKARVQATAASKNTAFEGREGIGLNGSTAQIG